MYSTTARLLCVLSVVTLANTRILIDLYEQGPGSSSTTDEVVGKQNELRSSPENCVKRDDGEAKPENHRVLIDLEGDPPIHHSSAPVKYCPPEEAAGGSDFHVGGGADMIPIESTGKSNKGQPGFDTGSPFDNDFENEM